MDAPALRVSDLTKVFERRRSAPVRAVDGVGFRLERGEVVGLLGPNGAGKTTTLKCLCLLVHPTRGRIWIQGVDALARPGAALRHVAATLEGTRNVYMRLTAQENLFFFAGLHGLSPRRARSDVGRLLELFGLTEKRGAVAQTLSRGMLQRLALACCLVKRTGLLLLDEPTLGLDVEGAHELRALIRETVARDGRTLLISSHDMDVVEDVCDRVLVLHRARLITDTRVRDLVRASRSRRYDIRVRGALDPGAVRLLEAAGARVEPREGGADIDLEVEKDEDVYGLLDVLRRAGVRLESACRHEPDLEEVFLRMVTRER